MFKKFLWIIAFVSSLMINQMVFADTSVCRESLNKMVQSLNLDATQKEKIRPILDQLKSTIKMNVSQMDGLESQVMEQVNSTSMDQEKVNSLVNQKTKMIGDMMKAKIMAKHQVFAILNPEQKGKLQDMMKRAEEKMKAAFKSCHEE
ncbi:MAG: Spy/CpxP family protein refolding chaperone [Gammaproteobacteria bacterium]